MWVALLGSALAKPRRADFPPAPSPAESGVPLASVVAWVGVALASALIVLATAALVRRVGKGKPGKRRSRLLTPFEQGVRSGREAAPLTFGHAAELLGSVVGSPVAAERAGDRRRRVRVERCASCRRGHAEACEFERGFLSGALAIALGRNVEVAEEACGRGKGPCAFVAAW